MVTIKYIFIESCRDVNCIGVNTRLIYYVD